MRLNVDRDFTNFVKNRLVDRTFVEGDTTLVMMLGHRLQFTVTKTRPRGIVRMTSHTKLQVLTEPAPEAKRVPRTTYEDIGGLKEQIQRIREMVELPMRHPEVFQRLGMDAPKGVLLHGPPGCGKTLLARAVSNESDVNFLSINGPEIMSKYYGESEARIRKMFKQAQKDGPSIIFIDELDAIAPKREEVRGEVERRVVAQLLALLDGLSGRGNVVVIAATNRPDIVDPAVLRPGRLDRMIYVPEPDKSSRLEIFKIHTKDIPLSKDVDMKELARVTKGYSGADIASVCREAAINGLRRDINTEEVTFSDFKEAMERILPSITPEMQNWYKRFMKEVRKPRKPAPLIA